MSNVVGLYALGLVFRDLPSGDPENPIYANAGRFEEEIAAKFRLLLSFRKDYAERTDKMIAAIDALDSTKDVSSLLALFTPKGS